jgi:alkylhydroperoxidase family enzyme
MILCRGDLVNARATAGRPVVMEETMRSRMSNPLEVVPELGDVAGALYKATGNGSVPQATMDLIGLRDGQIIGNTYVTIRQAAILRKAGESKERIAAVASWRDAPYFTDAERAALALVEAVLQPSTDGERVPDQLYAQAAKHYDAKALATLTAAIGQANFWNAFALIGKPLPGRPPSETWTSVAE